MANDWSLPPAPLLDIDPDLQVLMLLHCTLRGQPMLTAKETAECREWFRKRGVFLMEEVV